MKTEFIHDSNGVVLDQIATIAMRSSDPLAFATNIAEILLINGLISEPVYDILAGTN